MASDFFVAMFWIPVFVLTIAVIVGYVFLKKNGFDSNFSKLTGKRLFLGVAGALVVTILYTGVMALQLGIGKVGLGHITYSELSNLYFGYWVYYFVMFSPFILAGVVIVGIPVVYALACVRFASLFGILSISLVVAVIRGVMVFSSPYNNWCGAHPWECALDNFLDVFIACAVVSLGFGVGAKFPVWRNCATNT